MLTVDKLFENLDITVHPFAFCCAEAGSEMTLGPRNQSTIHYVLGGQGTLSFGGYPPFQIQEGAMIVAPTGAAHGLRGQAGAAAITSYLRGCRPLDVGLAELGTRVQDLNEGIALACGTVDATYRGLNNIFDYLPEPVMVQSGPGDVIWRSFDLIVRELTNPRPGTSTMLNALFQQCFVELIRQYSASEDCQLPWLSALEKPRLNKAIEEVIDNPGRRYSLELLAEMCAMSRTTFVEQFTESFGRTPMEFVKEIRLRAAARLLTGTDTPIKSIAARVGYESRSHFSRAFSGFFGKSPVEYRISNN